MYFSKHRITNLFSRFKSADRSASPFLTKSCTAQQRSWGQSQSFFLLSPEAALHIPTPRWSYAACAWIIHWHSSPGRLVHTGPWEEAAHSLLTAADRQTDKQTRTGEEPCRPRLTLFRWSILPLSAKHDPLTYRPNINNSGSISLPVPLETQTGSCLPHCYTRPVGLSRSVWHKPWTATSLQAGWVMTWILIINSHYWC